MKHTGVVRWDLVTLGNLFRNRYWGESDDRAYRSAICTCTLVTGTHFRLLVDPSLPEEAHMHGELERRTGCKAEDVDAVFLTHEHALFGLLRRTKMPFSQCWEKGQRRERICTYDYGSGTVVHVSLFVLRV